MFSSIEDALLQVALLLLALVIVRNFFRNRLGHHPDLRFPTRILLIYVLFYLLTNLPGGLDATVLSLAKSPVSLLLKALPVLLALWVFKQLFGGSVQAREELSALDSSSQIREVDEAPDQSDLQEDDGASTKEDFGATGESEEVDAVSVAGMARKRRATPQQYANLRVASLLRRRARSLKQGAFALLAAIVLSVIIGFWLFFSAGQLAATEQRALLRVLNEHQSSLEQRQTLDETLRRTLARFLEETAELGTGLETFSARDSATLHAVRNYIKDTAAVRADVNSMKTELEANLTQFENSLSGLSADIDEFRESQNQAHVLISSITTRIGSVLLLIFLVQILVAAYRYNNRLSSYCESRADALELELHSSGKLSELVASLSPESIAYGKEATTPSKELVEILRILDLGRK